MSYKNSKIQLNGIEVNERIETINFAGVVVIDDGNHKVTVVVDSGGSGTGIGNYDDVIEFGESGNVGNKFLKSSYSNHTSVDSTALALGSGEVVHVTISTEQDPINDWFLQVIINATKGGSGIFAGGTQIGADLVKPTAVLDKVYTDLIGYSFSASDRIQAYVKEGTLGSRKAVEPVVRLFVRYN